MSELDYQANQEGIAIIGMSGRFPQANSVEQFWRNLKDGKESISQFSLEEILSEQTSPAIAMQPNYVKARAILDDAELFDAPFFGLQPREAEIMDPQLRLLLECSWEALEAAGYDPRAYDNPIGVFVGTGFNYYLQNNLFQNSDLVKSFGSFQTLIGNDRDHVATIISYKLDLRGPSLTVQTACSTSLVAVHLACQSLLNGECSMALAGGSVVVLPRKSGYLFQDGGIMSPDGHCRPFDAGAAGTVAGSGAGVVLLKPLSAARADGDLIHAVIRGSAINNDGALKAGYTAPSIDGQAAVIAEAQAMAGVHPETISYIEAHGTATPLGDPIEIAALTQAFRAQTNERQFCAVGSVKSNVGHLDTAAGVTGLIKTALALEHELLPPTLHFEKPNPEIDFEQSPFFVNARLRSWERESGKPRRAGVSSFGIGGTNAHVIVEEAPLAVESEATSQNEWQVLALSARTTNSLESARQGLAQHLEQHPNVCLPDVAYTLQVGRRAFSQRTAVVCRDHAEAIAALRSHDSAREVSGAPLPGNRGVVFMFPGQGAQHVHMGRGLYEAGGEFRLVVDECAAVARLALNFDLRQILYPEAEDESASEQQLAETVVTQVALFAVEYALARQLEQWGIRPAAMIGHSLGEYVAACLSGIFTLDAAVKLVAERGRLMQELPRGALLAVSLGPDELRKEIAAVSNGNEQRLSLTAINAPRRTVVGGDEAAIGALDQHLGRRQIQTQRLSTSHAFHTAMVEPMLPAYEQALERAPKGELQVPFISNQSGDWADAGEVRGAQYWLRHIREPVRFSEGVAAIAATGNWVWLEVGPGRALGRLAKQTLLQRAQADQQDATQRHDVISTLAGGRDQEVEEVLRSVAQLWTYGADINWSKLRLWSSQESLSRAASDEQMTQTRQPRKVLLPTYAFDRRRFWIEHTRRAGSEDASQSASKTLAVPVGNGGDAATSEAGKLRETPSPKRASQGVSTETDRPAAIVARLKAIICDKSGVDVASLSAGISFFDLGFDSLLLIQISQGIKSTFGVDVAFRLLVEEYSTIGALAAYLDQIIATDQSEADWRGGGSRENQSTPFSQATGAGWSERLAAAASDWERSVNAHAQPSLNWTPSNDQPGAGEIETLLRHQLVLLQQVLINQQQSSSCMNIPVMPELAPKPAPPFIPTGYPASNRPATSSGEAAPFGPWRPVTATAADGLSPTQQQYLETFIARFTARTRKSKELAQSYRPVLADTRASAGFRRLWKELVYPIAGARSAGSKIWDEDGNEYTDVTMGFGVNLFGHAPAFITDALHEQLQNGIHIGPQSRLAGETAQLISDLTGAERVTFCNTGSEAVMAALRLARTVTGRTRIAVFAGSYHGIDDEVLVRSHNLDRSWSAAPASLGIPPHKLRDVILLPYDSADSLTVLERAMPELAAVLVEPVQSGRPEVQPREFLHQLRRLTADAGAALIFDEMITGFRVHPGGAQAWFEVQADLATYGKVAGGGMPIGIVAGKSRFMDAVDGGQWKYGDDSFPTVNQTFFAGTFCKHPLAMAAAKAVLTELKVQGPELQAELNSKTSQFAETLVSTFQRLNAPLSISHFGSLFRFRVPRDFQYTSLLVAHLLDKGIFIGDRAGFLSTAHSDQDLARVVYGVEQTVRELQEGGFLPVGSADDSDRGEQRHFYSRQQATRSTRAGPPVAGPVADSDQAENPTQGFRTVPLTEAQKGLLALMNTGDGASLAYNESMTMRLHGPFDVDRMTEAFQSVVDRHEALRSTFSLEKNHQRIHLKTDVKVPLLDFTSADEREREKSVAAFLEEESARVFDLENGPVISLRAAKLGEQEHLLSITTHHIASDGLSFDFIVAELCAFYRAACQNVPCSLPPPAQISEYVDWQNQTQNSLAMERSRNYWLAEFANGVPLVDLPTDRQRPPLQTYAGKLERTVLDSSLLGKLKLTAAQQGCTMFTVLLAAFMLMIHRQSRMRDIVVGTPSAGQSLMGDQPLVGYCLNTLPVRSRIDEAQSLADYLKSIRRRVLNAYDHQNYSLYRLVRDLRLVRDPSRHPMVSISFNMDRVGAKPDFADLKVEILENPRVFATFDVSWNVVETTDKLYVDCVYNSDLFNPARSKHWIAVYELLLNKISESADNPIRDLVAVIDEATRKNLAAREKSFRQNRQETLRSVRRQAVGLD